MGGNTTNTVYGTHQEGGFGGTTHGSASSEVLVNGSGSGGGGGSSGGTGAYNGGNGSMGLMINAGNGVISLGKGTIDASGRAGAGSTSSGKGGGGGGSGGHIILKAATINISSAKIYAYGGAGGPTSAVPTTTNKNCGGGGGGGGRVVLDYATLYNTSTTINVAGGNAGNYHNCSTPPTAGSDGTLYYKIANTAPVWTLNTTNSTLRGATVLHSINWTDDTALSGYIFSINNGTGTFTNDTWISMNGVMNWSNITKRISTNYNASIVWQVFANDSNNAWNSTGNLSYLTTDNVPTQGVPSVTPFSTATQDNNITCSNQSTADIDSDTVTNVYNWLINGSSLMLLNMPFEINVSSWTSSVKDYSGRGANGVINGTLNWTNSGMVGGAYNFTSNNMLYINVSNSSLNLPGNFTINFWVKPYSISALYGIFSKGNTSEGIATVNAGDNFLTIYYDGKTAKVKLPPVNVWTMITVVCNTTNCDYYNSTILLNSTAATVVNNTKYPLLIGKGGYNTAGVHRGPIDEFRVYNRTLTFNQIYQLYQDQASGYSNSSVIVGGEVVSGNNWTCQVTPNDAISDGSTSQNYTIIVASTPPTITLSSPATASSVIVPNSNYNTFICNATDDKQVANISLYGNFTGSWANNQTITTTGTSNTSYSVNFTVKGLDDGYYVWNCLVFDNNSQSTSATSNFTLTNDYCGITQITTSGVGYSPRANERGCVFYNITGHNDILSLSMFGDNNASLFGVSAWHTYGLTITVNMNNYSGGIYFNNVNNSIINGTTIYNITSLGSGDVAAVGVQLNNSYNITIINTGINYVNATSSSVTGCYNNSYSYGVYSYGGKNLTIQNSNITNVHGEKQGQSGGEGCDTSRYQIGDNVYSYSSPNITIFASNISDGYYGVYPVGSNFTNISNNNFSDFDSDGLYFSSASNNATINSNVFVYSSNAILFDGTSNFPNITNNNISYGSMAVYIQSGEKGAEIINNTIMHTNGSTTQTGAMYLAANPLGTFDNNIVYNDTNNGSSAGAVFISTYSATLYRLNVTNSYAGIVFYGAGASNSKVYNSTFASIRNWSANVIANNITFFNVTFDTSLIHVQGGQFFSYRYLWVNVTNQTYGALNSANVNTTDVFNMLSQGTTDSTGLTSMFNLLEFNQTSTNVTHSAPYNISAYLTGYSTNYTSDYLNISKVVWLMLISPYILSYVPVSNVFSIVENNSQTFSIIYTNTTAVSIKWFVNDSRQTSYDNNSQFIWTGNYSQQGTYNIKVNISNIVGEDQESWNMTVNDTVPFLDLDWIYPTDNLSVSQNSFFNMTLNVTCKNADCGTVNVSLDPASITVQLDSSYDMADVIGIASVGGNYSSQIKWNISSIPSFATITDAKLCLYINSSDGSPDNNLVIWRVDDQTWDESLSVAGYNGEATTNQTTTTLSSTTVFTWSCINVTIILNTDHTLGKNYSTVRVEDPDYNFTSAQFVSNAVPAMLVIGSGSGPTRISFRDREQMSNTPYLNITYSFLKTGLISTTTGAKPFYTNSSTNPITTGNLNVSNGQLITFWINATGDVGANYIFYSFANFTSNMSISNTTSNWNITIISPPVSVALDLSTKLSQQINWTLASLPITDQAAEGNNGTDISEYFANVSVTGGTADLYMRASGDLKTSGGDVLGLGNETYSYNSTNSSVPSSSKTALTTGYALIGSGLPDKTAVYIKFFLSAPSAQPAGTYNNSLDFKVVPNGQTP